MNLRIQEAHPAVDDTRLITLTQGQFAIVDTADYAWLSQWKWHAQWHRSNNTFYATRDLPEINKKRYGTMPMHRQILGLARGDKRMGDHVNGQPLDNRRSNLRIATSFENQHNRRIRRDSTSGFKGVFKVKDYDYWKAEIVVNGIWIYLGVHPTPEEAHAAYCEAAKRYCGEFANPG